MEIQWILLRNIVKSIDVMEPTIDEQSLEAELASLKTNQKAKYCFIELVKSGMAFYLHFTKKTENHY